MAKKVELYSVREDVICLSCGNKGAVQPYAEYYPKGVGNLADEITAFEYVRNKPHMSPYLGFGGTIPYRCMNCGKQGLIDFGGLEGYKQCFKTIE